MQHYSPGTGETFNVFRHTPEEEEIDWLTDEEEIDWLNAHPDSVPVFIRTSSIANVLAALDYYFDCEEKRPPALAQRLIEARRPDAWGWVTSGVAGHPLMGPVATLMCLTDGVMRSTLVYVCSAELAATLPHYLRLTPDGSMFEYFAPMRPPLGSQPAGKSW
jgi:hypothetical protein